MVPAVASFRLCQIALPAAATVIPYPPTVSLVVVALGRPCACAHTTALERAVGAPFSVARDPSVAILAAAATRLALLRLSLRLCSRCHLPRVVVVRVASSTSTFLDAAAALHDVTAAAAAGAAITTAPAAALVPSVRSSVSLGRFHVGEALFLASGYAPIFARPGRVPRIDFVVVTRCHQTF